MALDSKRPVQTFALTDLGNAERLIARHGRDLRWVDAGKKWLVWDGTRWTFDGTRRVERFAKATARSIWHEAAKAESSDRQKDIVQHARAAERAANLRSMLHLAGAEEGIAILPSDLDADPMLLCCRNGTVDLTTGTLRPHCREDLITKRSPVVYDEGAECPQWLAFLARVFDCDESLIGYVQRACGYSLTGDTREQCLHLLHGSGANGKSTFIETLSAMMGDYATQADFATFLEKKGDGPRNDIARLAGARLVRSSEIGEGKKLNEALVKSLTGSETISARFLYEEAFEFTPAFKLWLSANHKPVIRGTDYAIWRRVRLIPFEVTIPESERDDTLGATLRGELPGILRWAIEGCLAWLEDGLRPPGKVVAATTAYRTESDILGSFLEECCLLAPGNRSAAGDLYGGYKRWAKDAGEWVLTQTAFGRQLEERGLHAVKSHGTKWRYGIQLTPDMQSSLKASPNGNTPWHDR